MRPTTQVSGGDRLAQRLRELQARYSRQSNVLVGVPESAGAYEDGTKIAVIAAVHEFGSANGHIPERSFLRVPLRSAQEKFQQIFRNQLPLVNSGELSMFQLLSQVGASAVGESQEAMQQGIQPPLAQSTIKRRKHGGSTPLIDEGDLRRSITYVVEDAE